MLSGSGRLGIEGLLVGDSLKALYCVLEQDTLSSAYIYTVLVQSRKTGKCPDMAGKLSAGIHHFHVTLLFNKVAKSGLHKLLLLTFRIFKLFAF